MTPYWSDDHLTLYGGDCRDVLRELPGESVHCVVTSPPYWGLRDYGVAGQLGLEPTPEEYVANMVAVFREVRRVLRSDGTLWLNLGDSYHSGRGVPASPDGKLAARRFGKRPQDGIVAGLKPKDLIGLPWRVALALQADGWWLRCDVVWEKPNTLPEPSAHDRPDRNHEYLFLLSSGRRYHFDKDAIREESDPAQEAHNRRYAKVYAAHSARAAREGQPGNVNNVGIHSRPGKGGRPKRSVWKVSTVPYPGDHPAPFPPRLVEPCILSSCPEGGTVLDPFAGSGTTLLVAQALGRRGVGIDLNPDYLRQALARNAQAPLGLVG